MPGHSGPPIGAVSTLNACASCWRHVATVHGLVRFIAARAVYSCNESCHAGRGKASYSRTVCSRRSHLSPGCRVAVCVSAVVRRRTPYEPVALYRT